MPRCTHCDAEVQPDRTVCPECGAAVSSTAAFEPVGAGADDAPIAHEGVDGPALVVRKGPQPGEVFYLDRPRLTIGRDPSSDIFLNDMTVSRAHAVLTMEGATVSVQDERSLNGTYVNGICVDHTALRDGDVVQIGTFQMVYHGQA